jgi:hypothetical protein
MSALSINSPTAYSFSGGVLDQYLVNVNLAVNETLLNTTFKALRAEQELQSGNLSPYEALKARNTISSAYGTASSTLGASQSLEILAGQSTTVSAQGQVSVTASGYNSLLQTANFGDSTGYLAHLIQASATPVANPSLIRTVVA